jgi:hypothetical protein
MIFSCIFRWWRTLRGCFPSSTRACPTTRAPRRLSVLTGNNYNNNDNNNYYYNNNNIYCYFLVRGHVGAGRPSALYYKRHYKRCILKCIVFSKSHIAEYCNHNMKSKPQQQQQQQFWHQFVH